MEPEVKFRQYPSIELSTRGNFVEKIKKQYADPKYLWVASQKIHGCNFSIFCDGKIVKYGRRNDFITKEIPIEADKVDTYFLENFYDARNLVLKFHNKLGDLFKDLQSHYKDLLSFTIYGQYFGGNWIGNDPAKLKAVQTGIKYTPNHEFFAFDVNVKTATEDLWIPATELEARIGKHIRTVPVYAKGNFQQVYAVNTKIDSTIPELLGLQKVQNNLIQGMVLRPNETYFVGDQRVMLKKKNAQFQQKAPVENKKAAKKEQKQLPAQINEPLNELLAYLNKNRLESVLSKFPDVKDRNKLKKQVFDDILKDAEKDQFKKPNADVFKKVSQELDKKIMKAIADYFSAN